MGAPFDRQVSELGRISPARFLSFSFPSPYYPSNPSCYGDPLRVAVLDSPLPAPTQPITAAMLVPLYRESDWVFSTESGHLQLLLSSAPALPVSRLILVGNQAEPGVSPEAYARPDPAGADPESLERFQQSLLPLLLALAPKAAFRYGIPEIPFLSYEDEVVRSAPVEKLVGPVVGEMLVEDVEVDAPPAPELRRRLRFKRMPNLVQSQVRLLPDSDSTALLRPESGSLVQPYLGPMVAGLSLVASSFEEHARLGSRPRALCIGVGGGALLMFLRSRLGFNVVGVEADGAVLSVARRHFGLVEGDFLKVVVNDGIEFIESFAREQETSQSSENGRYSDRHCRASGYAGVEVRGDLFDAVMVDLDAGDAKNGVTAPPLEFVQKRVLAAARLALKKHGILIMNAIPQNQSTYGRLADALGEAFSELYELDVGNGENYVLIATSSPVGSVTGEKRGPWIEKLKQAIGEGLVDSIKKI